MWSRVCVHDGEKKCVTVASNTYECMAQAVCVCEDQFMCLYEMICTREWEASAAYRNIAAMAGSRASNGSKWRKKEITTNETRSIYIDINETGAHAHNSPAIYYTIEYFAGLFFFSLFSFIVRGSKRLSLQMHCSGAESFIVLCRIIMFCFPSAFVYSPVFQCRHPTVVVVDQEYCQACSKCTCTRYSYVLSWFFIIFFSLPSLSLCLTHLQHTFVLMARKNIWRRKTMCALLLWNVICLWGNFCREQQHSIGFGAL